MSSGCQSAPITHMYLFILFVGLLSPSCEVLQRSLSSCLPRNSHGKPLMRKEWRCRAGFGGSQSASPVCCCPHSSFQAQISLSALVELVQDISLKQTTGAISQGVEISLTPATAAQLLFSPSLQEVTDQMLLPPDLLGPRPVYGCTLESQTFLCFPPCPS